MAESGPFARASRKPIGQWVVNSDQALRDGVERICASKSFLYLPQPPYSCSCRPLRTLITQTVGGPTRWSAAPRGSAGRSVSVTSRPSPCRHQTGGGCRTVPSSRSTSRVVPRTATSTCAGEQGSRWAKSSSRRMVHSVCGSRPTDEPALTVAQGFSSSHVVSDGRKLPTAAEASARNTAAVRPAGSIQHARHALAA